MAIDRRRLRFGRAGGEMRLSRWIVFALLACGTLACAEDSDRPPGLDYAEHEGAEFPAKGATLPETLDHIVAPRTTNALVTTRDLRVLRIDVEPWQEIPKGDVKAGALGPQGARYAVVASLYCYSDADHQRLFQEDTAWYLLPEGRLAAWNHYEFGDACTVLNEFEPARGNQASDEKHLLEYVKKSFPSSGVHVNELYLHGIAYAHAGRTDDAQAMLDAGDKGFDFTVDEKINANQGYDIRYTGDRAKMRSLRGQLVRALQEARGSQGATTSP
jgi:hypothetical protein